LWKCQVSWVRMNSLQSVLMQRNYCQVIKMPLSVIYPPTGCHDCNCGLNVCRLLHCHHCCCCWSARSLQISIVNRLLLLCRVSNIQQILE
jgi:hypothetical protein